MTQDTVSFEVSAEDSRLIDRIASRAMEHNATDLLSLRMDLTACHANGCPLDLERLLSADDFNFCHDVFGIRQYMDRSTGKLMNSFLPRFAFTAAATKEQS